jgi:hypothetical protein
VPLDWIARFGVKRTGQLIEGAVVLFYPKLQPRVFSERDREAEQDVWRALSVLDAWAPHDHRWHVFYSVTEEDEQGYDREIDYILVWRNRIIYVEVKGGHVLVDRPARGNTRWLRRKQNGTELEPVQPAQLWNAKKAIWRMIKRELGAHPKQLGFVEYEFHVFPQTSRSYNGGRTFNRGSVYYVFQEDLQAWPAQLEALVRSRGNKFATAADITRLFSCLEALSYQPDSEGAYPAYGATPDQPVRQLASLGNSPAPYSAHQPPRRFDLTWKRVLLPWIFGVAGFSLILLAWPLFEPGRPVVPAKVAAPAKSLSETAGPPKPQSRPAGSAPASVSAPMQKALPAQPEDELPAFIPAGATAEIEQIFETARIPNMSLRWSAGSQYGYVTLQADEGNGCRRWRLSRNDTAPVFDFVRRCSSR